jgi:hypothetical protein
VRKQKIVAFSKTQDTVHFLVSEKHLPVPCVRFFVFAEFLRGLLLFSSDFVPFKNAEMPTHLKHKLLMCFWLYGM